jgi:uncharacterized SAM-binding protein YcdF (DUF218 family)
VTLFRLPSWLRRLVWLCTAVVLLWCSGLAYFIARGFTASESPAKTDGIVVLTGGRQRIEVGLDLLLAGRAQKLFISGVNQRVDREELLHLLGPEAERAACCIVLGHEADSTFGNARETANWMNAEGYRSIQLVTSWYHMPRSLLEFRRVMPQVRIIAHPVFAQHFAPGEWETWHNAPIVVLGEYSKYLASIARPLWYPLLPQLDTGHADRPAGKTVRLRSAGTS